MKQTLQRFLAATRGASAIEFAAALPFMVLLFFGGYVSTQAVAIGRKVTITTRALADLTSQYPSMSPTDAATVVNASAQIIAPFSATPLTIRLSEITTDVTGLIPTITCSTDRATYPPGKVVSLPQAMLKPNTSYILSEVTYTYAPPIFNGGIGPYAISDSLYTLPRLSPSVTCPSNWS